MDQVLINSSKERRIIRTYEAFFASADNQINNLNLSILNCYDSLHCKTIERKNKLDDNFEKKIYKDIMKILEMMQPDENLRPVI